jgi:uncharacterized protein YjgD (DUF1641 family)
VLGLAGISLFLASSLPAQTAPRSALQNLPPGLVSPANRPAPFPAGASLSSQGASPLPLPVVSAPTAQSAPLQPPHVEWRNGELSIRAESYPLSRIIQHVAKIADVDVSGLDKVTGNASVNFSGQPLSRGFETLLPGWDYAFTQPNPARGLRGQLMILARGGPVPDFPKPGPAIAKAPEKGSDDDDDWDDDTPEEQAAILKLRQAASKDDQQALKAAIANTDSTIQQNAFDLLKAIDAQAAIDALLPMTNSANAQIAVQSLALLQRSGADPDTILNALGTAMDSSTASVKAYAVQSLANYGEGSLRFMLQAMSDPDRNIRFSVLQSAGRFPWASSIVQQATSDSDEQVRNLAAQFLHQQSPAQPGQPPQPGQPQPDQVQPNQPSDPNQPIVAGQADASQDTDSDDSSDDSSDDDTNSPN